MVLIKKNRNNFTFTFTFTSLIMIKLSLSGVRVIELLSASGQYIVGKQQEVFELTSREIIILNPSGDQNS
jgi:hypothetical protein